MKVERSLASNRRTRGKARREVPIEDESEPDLALLPEVEDLQISTPASPTLRPLKPRAQEWKGIQTVFFRSIYLTTIAATVEGTLSALLGFRDVRSLQNQTIRGTYDCPIR